MVIDGHLQEMQPECFFVENRPYRNPLDVAGPCGFG